MAKKTTTKEVAAQTDMDIARLLSEAAEMDGQNQADLGGNRVPYIKCISNPEDAVLDKSSPDYIPKAVYKGFCVPTSKLNLGTEFFYSVMGIFAVYEEKVKPKDKNGIPPIVGYWMPEQARQVPIAEGSYFDREFVAKDGEIHVLSPVHWVFGLIVGHEDLGVHNMVFRSTASKNAKDLQKILKDVGGMSCSVQVKVVAEKAEFKNYNKITFRPMFEATDRVNFKIKGTAIVPGEWTKAEVAEFAKLYHDLQANYSQSKMVANRDVATAVAALPDHKTTKF